MAWPGTVHFKTTIAGPGAGMEVLGGSFVPRKASFVVDGADGAPNLLADFEIRDGRPECLHFSITATPGGRGIRTGDIQAWNLDVLASNVFAHYATPVDGESEVVPPPTPDLARRAFKDVYEARKSTRGTITKAELERVAKVYRENLAKSPTRAVAIALGLDERTASRRVQRAREAGLLPPTTRGKRKA